MVKGLFVTTGNILGAFLCVCVVVEGRTGCLISPAVHGAGTTDVMVPPGCAGALQCWGLASCLEYAQPGPYLLGPASEF